MTRSNRRGQAIATEERSLRQMMAEFCNVWLVASNRSPRTIRAYRIDLDQFGTFVGVDNQRAANITSDDVLRWVVQLQQGDYSPASVRRKLAALRAFFGVLEKRGMITKSPLQGLRLQLGETRRVTKALSATDVAALLRTVSRRIKIRGQSAYLRCLSMRDRAIFRVLMATGIRVGELASLTMDQLDIRHRVITVLGKGRRERQIPLVHPMDVLQLVEYLKLRWTLNPSTNIVFVDRTGKAMTTDAVRSMMRSVARDAGLRGALTPHMLRHTAATRLLEHGADLRVVQVLLGHQSIRSTERYTHVCSNHLKRVLRRCHPLRNVV